MLFLIMFSQMWGVWVFFFIFFSSMEYDNRYAYVMKSSSIDSWFYDDPFVMVDNFFKSILFV